MQDLFLESSELSDLQDLSIALSSPSLGEETRHAIRVIREAWFRGHHA